MKLKLGPKQIFRPTDGPLAGEKVYLHSGGTLPLRWKGGVGRYDHDMKWVWYGPNTSWS